MNRALRALGKGVGYLWATPTTLIAFIFLIGPAWLARQVVHLGFVEGAWEFALAKESWLNRKYGTKFSAICFGWSITYTSQGLLSRTCIVHERAHIVQQWVMGPFYLPIWFIFTGIFGYRLNPFEIQANEWAWAHNQKAWGLFEAELPKKEYYWVPTETPALGTKLVEEVKEPCPECDFPLDFHNCEYTKQDGVVIPAKAFVFLEGEGMVSHETCIEWKKADDAKLAEAIAQLKEKREERKANVSE